MERFLLQKVALFSVLALGGCDGEAKPLPEGKMEYAGNWAGQDMKLVIEAGGLIDYERDGTSIQAPIQTFEGNDFTVGFSVLSTTFDVEEAPHQAEDGTWQMKVDGVDLVRIDEDEILRLLAEQAKE